MEEALRVDVVLHRLCLTRSRSEAKSACDSGAVLVGERTAKASDTVHAGAVITLNFPRRRAVVEVLELPPKSTSRKQAREMVRILHEEVTALSL